MSNLSDERRLKAQLLDDKEQSKDDKKLIKIIKNEKT